jgi:hypothetical protein
MIRKRPAPHLDCGVGTDFPNSRAQDKGDQIMTRFNLI